jgi:hypothetical protein
VTGTFRQRDLSLKSNHPDRGVQAILAKKIAGQQMVEASPDPVQVTSESVEMVASKVATGEMKVAAGEMTIASTRESGPRFPRKV